MCFGVSLALVHSGLPECIANLVIIFVLAQTSKRIFTLDESKEEPGRLKEGEIVDSV